MNVNAVQLGKHLIINVYASPKEITDPTLTALEDLIAARDNAIVAGDLNCRWPGFSDKRMRERDGKFCKFISQNQMGICNNSVATCTQQERYTTNNYTLVKDSNLSNWEVDEYTSTYSTQ